MINNNKTSKSNLSNDITFQSLLQNQRSLLSKMNFEKKALKVKKREQEEKRVRQFIRKHFNHQRTYLDNNHNRNASIDKDKFHSIIDKFNSISKDDPALQTLTTEALDPFPLDSNEQSRITFPKRRRLSLGIGNDQFMLPEPQDGSKKVDIDDEPLPINSEPIPINEQLHINEPLPIVAHKEPLEAQNELSSDDEDYGVFVTDVVEKPQMQQRSFSAPSSRRSSVVASAINAKRRASSCSFFQTTGQLGIAIARQHRQHMISFESSMGDSVESQQKIHDWDRKMGLKRSHSKTMRLSMRSRKKLRQVMQKEILQISKILYS